MLFDRKNAGCISKKRESGSLKKGGGGIVNRKTKFS
jgi:hypothetical protein